MTDRICRNCGESENRADYACMMSDDGESPHRWTKPEPPIPPKHLPFLQSVAHHIEQGEQER